MGRDPVVVNQRDQELRRRSVDRDTARRRRWHAVARGRADRASLYLSSPIGLATCSATWRSARDAGLAAPRSRDRLVHQVDPAAAYLAREGERLHPICAAPRQREPGHFEAQAGEHDLQAFFALRTMDEVMARNFLVFAELSSRPSTTTSSVGDEAWEVDYHYKHENPELKRQPFVFLTDFVGCLPMEEGNEREAFLLCADRNADEHRARRPLPVDPRPRALRRQPGRRDRAAVRPGVARHPRMDRGAISRSPATRWPFDPAQLADTGALRARHGYRADERRGLPRQCGWVGCRHAPVAPGRCVVRRGAEADPRPEDDHGHRPAHRPSPSTHLPDVEVHGFLPDLDLHHAACDIAVVQGGLSTTMELTANGRPFLYFPLGHHFEQQICTSAAASSVTTPAGASTSPATRTRRRITQHPWSRSSASRCPTSRCRPMAASARPSSSPS